MEILSTLAVGLLVAGLLTVIIYKEIKNRKSGKGGCSCGCSGCGMSEICRLKK